MISVIRPCTERDLPTMYGIINDGAQAYKGIIAEDLWHEPYMPMDDLKNAIATGVVFWGYEDAGTLLGIMGIQTSKDVTLIRHAYVRTRQRGSGIGGKLLTHLSAQAQTPVLVGTWKVANWAIRFYEKHGFMLYPANESMALLRKYWSISERQMETSVVLGKNFR